MWTHLSSIISCPSVSLKQLQCMLKPRCWIELEMSPQWVTGLGTVVGQWPCSRCDSASLESLCRTAGATQNSKGCHLVSIGRSHSTLCMCVRHCVCMCSYIDLVLYNSSPSTTDGRPAPDLCFKKVNEAGDMYGNCGKDLFGKYRSCKDRWRSKPLGSFTPSVEVYISSEFF